MTRKRMQPPSSLCRSSPACRRRPSLLTSKATLSPSTSMRKAAWSPLKCRTQPRFSLHRRSSPPQGRSASDDLTAEDMIRMWCGGHRVSKCRLPYSAGVVPTPGFVQEDFNSACGTLPSRQDGREKGKCPPSRAGMRGQAPRSIGRTDNAEIGPGSMGEAPRAGFEPARGNPAVFETAALPD